MAVLISAHIAAAEMVRKRFRDAEALTPSRAILLGDLSHLEQRVLADLVTAGDVRETADGYYLDESVAENRRRVSGRVLGLVAIAVILAFVVLAIVNNLG